MTECSHPTLVSHSPPGSVWTSSGEVYHYLDISPHLTFSILYSDPRHDPHPVRLLTLARTSRAAPDTSSVCLAIAISTRDKAIIVSCQDTQVTACVYINSILKM